MVSISMMHNYFRLVFIIFVIIIISCIIIITNQRRIIEELNSSKKKSSYLIKNIQVPNELPEINFLPSNNLMPGIYGDDSEITTSLQPLDNIPKIFHFLWKTNRLPARAAANIKEWRRLHPDWTFVFWTDADVSNFIDTVLPTSSIRTMWRAYPEQIMRIDFIRYVILYLIGGVYADIDVRAKHPLDPLIRHHSCILVREPEIYAIPLNYSSVLLVSNFLMASRPGHPFWPHLMEEAKHRSKKGNVLFRTGPEAVNAAVRTYKGAHPFVFRDASVFVAPSIYFEPPYGPKGHPIHYKFMKTLVCRRNAKPEMPFVRHLCDVLHREDRLDWTVQYRYPRHFRYSFTEHQKLDSYGKTFKKRFSRESSIAKISYRSLRLVPPMTLVKRLKMTDIYEYDEKIMNKKTGQR